MSRLALLVLAAGMGSRYGGIKQMAPVGSCGEFVLDYSVYDGIRSGFDQIVLVIRPELEEPLREHFKRLPAGVRVDYVIQDMEDLPGGYKRPEGRRKPWGTGHAIWAARKVIDVPFAAINADDFYGAESFKVLADYLGRGCDASHYAMVGFQLSNTLSDYGTVSRGVAAVDAAGRLLSVTERSGVEATDGAVRCRLGDGYMALTGKEPVSLNFWGFAPSIFHHLEEQMKEFLAQRINEPGSEYYIPSVVDRLVHSGEAEVAVLPCSEKWYGMTYSQDREKVAAAIASMTAAGRYPEDLWQ